MRGHSPAAAILRYGQVIRISFVPERGIEPRAVSQRQTLLQSLSTLASMCTAFLLFLAFRASGLVSLEFILSLEF